MWFWWHSFKACFLLGTDGILSCIIVEINHHPPQEWYPTYTDIQECLWNIHSIAMSGALAEGEYKIDCNHKLDRSLQNMPHHLRRLLEYGRQRGQNTDRRPLEANSTESLPLREVSSGRRPPGASFSAPSREVSRERRPPGASSSSEVSRLQAPPRATPARTSREVSRGRAPPRASSSTMPREVSRGRVPPRASHSKMSQEVSGGRAPPRAFFSSSSVAPREITHREQGRRPGHIIPELQDQSQEGALGKLTRTCFVIFENSQPQMSQHHLRLLSLPNK